MPKRLATTLPPTVIPTPQDSGRDSDLPESETHQLKPSSPWQTKERDLPCPGMGAIGKCHSLVGLMGEASTRLNPMTFHLIPIMEI